MLFIAYCRHFLAVRYAFLFRLHSLEVCILMFTMRYEFLCSRYAFWLNIRLRCNEAKCSTRSLLHLHISKKMCQNCIHCLCSTEEKGGGGQYAVCTCYKGIFCFQNSRQIVSKHGNLSNYAHTVRIV